MINWIRNSEYATVGYFEWNLRLSQNTNLARSYDELRQDNQKSRQVSKSEGSLFKIVGQKDASTTDKVSRWVFPIIFILFNVIYWVVYLNLSSQHFDDLIILKDFWINFSFLTKLD